MKTILVVDDEAYVRKLVAACLRKTQFRILHAEDGDQALAMAAAEKPDLILMDVVLSGAGPNGLQATKLLKSNPETAFHRVILMSGRKPEIKPEDWKAAGAVAFMVKPFNPIELRETISNYLLTETNSGAHLSTPSANNHTKPKE